MENEEIKLHYCNKNICLVDEEYCRDYCKYRKAQTIQDFEPSKCAYYFSEEMYVTGRKVESALNSIFGNSNTCNYNN